MEDDHVDRPGVEAQQCVELTGTNRSFGLIALVANARSRALADDEDRRWSPAEPPVLPRRHRRSFLLQPENEEDKTEKTAVRPLPLFVLRIRPLPAWWLLQGDQTRSHPELGRQTP